MTGTRDSVFRLAFQKILPSCYPAEDIKDMQYGNLQLKRSQILLSGFKSEIYLLFGEPGCGKTSVVKESLTKLSKVNEYPSMLIKEL